MIKNIISFLIPLAGLAFLGFSFHYLDKYPFPEKPVDNELENQSD